MTNKILIISGLLFLFSVKAIAKNTNNSYSDTIRMQMPNGTTIESRSTYDGKHALVNHLEIKTVLNDFLLRWATLNIKELDPNKAYHIKCKKEKEYIHLKNNQDIITIDELSIQKKIYFPVDTSIVLLVKGNNKLEFNSKLAIYFSTIKQLEELKEADFNQILKNTDKEILKNSDWYLKSSPFVAWVEIQNDNTAELLHQNNTLSGTKDQIIISAGTSLENVKGDWNGSFYANLSLQLGSKSLAKQAFSLGYEWMYDFSSGKENINHWIDFGYQYNFSKDPNDPSWFGLNLGYLVKRNGDLFEKDSFRLGIEKKIHKNISIVPQIYFHNFFQDVYPGFKIKIHL